MRSLTKYEAFDQRVLHFMAGHNWKECRQIADGIKANVFDVRKSLVRLVDAGLVVERARTIGPRTLIEYQRAQNGHCSGPGAA